MCFSQAFRNFPNLFCIRFSVMLILVPFKTFFSNFLPCIMPSEHSNYGSCFICDSSWSTQSLRSINIYTNISFLILTIVFTTHSPVTLSAFFGKPWIKIWSTVLFYWFDLMIHWSYWTYHLYMFLNSWFFLFFCLFSIHESFYW